MITNFSLIGNAAYIEPLTPLQIEYLNLFDLSVLPVNERGYTELGIPDNLSDTLALFLSYFHINGPGYADLAAISERFIIHVIAAYNHITPITISDNPDLTRAVQFITLILADPHGSVNGRITISDNITGAKLSI